MYRPPSLLFIAIAASFASAGCSKPATNRGNAGAWIANFDDLPVPYRGNVDVHAPFDRHAGDQPALTEDDIKDIVTFLNTLTDG